MPGGLKVQPALSAGAVPDNEDGLRGIRSWQVDLTVMSGCSSGCRPVPVSRIMVAVTFAAFDVIPPSVQSGNRAARYTVRRRPLRGSPARAFSCTGIGSLRFPGRQCRRLLVQARAEGRRWRAGSPARAAGTVPAAPAQDVRAPSRDRAFGKLGWCG